MPEEDEFLDESDSLKIMIRKCDNKCATCKDSTNCLTCKKSSNFYPIKKDENSEEIGI